MDVIAPLKALLEAARAAELGFQRAAGVVTRSRLRGFLARCAEPQTRFAAELERELRRVAPDAGELTGIVRSLHAGWERLAPALAQREESAVVAAVERGAAGTLDAYEAALAAPIPPGVLRLVEGRRRGLGETRRRLGLLGLRRRSARRRPAGGALSPGTPPATAPRPRRGRTSEV